MRVAIVDDADRWRFKRIRGTVLSEDTHLAVKGAIVVARWRSAWRGVALGIDEVQDHYEAATSDAHGGFEIGLPPPRFLFRRAEREIKVFREGMLHVGDEVRRSGHVQVRMRPFKGTGDDVLQQCLLARTWCGRPVRGNVALAPLYRQLLRMATPIVGTLAQREVAVLLANDLRILSS